MFTGIVEEKGIVSSISQNGSSLSLAIKCSFASELDLGESVAVNGTCLTVTSINSSGFTADVTPESFRRTSLGQLCPDSSVNLERAMKADGRFGGHIVSGHVDGTGLLTGFANEGNAVNISVCVDNSLGKYIIEKGSVCIDGISLTVASVKTEGSQTFFTAAVIPHTWEHTTLSSKTQNSIVNIECDTVAKYIEHFLLWNKNTGSGLSDSALKSMMTNYTSFH